MLQVSVVGYSLDAADNGQLKTKQRKDKAEKERSKEEEGRTKLEARSQRKPLFAPNQNSAYGHVKTLIKSLGRKREAKCLLFVSLLHY